MIALAVIALFGSVTQADGPAQSEENSSGIFVDVPANHWSIASLSYLRDRGLINGLPGNRWDGDSAMTRYQAAQIMADTVKYVENQLENLDVAVADGAQGVPPEDFQILQDLIFKISDRVQELSTEVDGIENIQPGIDPELANRIRALESQEEQVEVLTAQLEQANSDIRTLKDQFTTYQINDSSVSEQDMLKTNQNILANRIIAIFSFGAALVAIGLLTLR